MHSISNKEDLRFYFKNKRKEKHVQKKREESKREKKTFIEQKLIN